MSGVLVPKEKAKTLYVKIDNKYAKTTTPTTTNAPLFHPPTQTTKKKPPNNPILKAFHNAPYENIICRQNHNIYLMKNARATAFP